MILKKYLILRPAIMHKIKRLVSVFLVLLIMIKSASMIAIVLSYECNKKYYEEVLCVNKNKPELACKGKCAFMKKMEVAMETRQKNNTNDFISIILKALESPVYSRDHFNDPFSILNIHTTAPRPVPTFNIADLGNTGNVFHPPIA